MYLTFYFWFKMTVEVSLLLFFTGFETCQENLKFDQFPEPGAPSPPLLSTGSICFYFRPFHFDNCFDL